MEREIWQGKFVCVCVCVCVFILPYSMWKEKGAGLLSSCLIADSEGMSQIVILLYDTIEEELVSVCMHVKLEILITVSISKAKHGLLAAMLNLISNIFA